MCLLPPNCILCAHYNNNQDQTESSRDCRAFKEIPEDIFFGGNLHTMPYQGDNGILFSLRPEYVGEYAEIEELRISLKKHYLNTQ